LNSSFQNQMLRGIRRLLEGQKFRPSDEKWKSRIPQAPKIDEWNSRGDKPDKKKSLYGTVGFLRRQDRPLSDVDLKRIAELVFDEKSLSNSDEKCLSLTLSLLVSPMNFKTATIPTAERLCQQLEVVISNGSLSLQGCNQTLGAFAKLKTKKPERNIQNFTLFFDKILDFFSSKFLPDCPNRELSNLFWAARVLGLSESPFIPTLEQKLKSFDSCDISLVCAGLMDAPDHELWASVRQELLTRQRFADKDIGSILCSLACAGVNDRELILHMTSVIHRTELLSWRNVPAVVWAIATCDFVDRKMVEKAVRILEENGDRITDPMDVRRISRGFAVAGQLKQIESWILEEAIRADARTGLADTLLIWELVTNNLTSSALKLFRNRPLEFWESQIREQPMNASQLYHLYLGCLLEGNCDFTQKEISFLKSLQSAFSSITEDMSSSVLHRQASDAVRNLKYEHVSEYNEPKTGYVVDIYIPNLGVAVEVQGPTHFLTDVETGAMMLRPPDIFKQNVLRKVGGLRVVHATPFNFGPKVRGKSTVLMKAIIEGKPAGSRKAKKPQSEEE